MFDMCNVGNLWMCGVCIVQRVSAWPGTCAKRRVLGKLQMHSRYINIPFPHQAYLLVSARDALVKKYSGIITSSIQFWCTCAQRSFAGQPWWVRLSEESKYDSKIPTTQVQRMYGMTVFLIMGTSAMHDPGKTARTAQYSAIQPSAFQNAGYRYMYESAT